MVGSESVGFAVAKFGPQAALLLGPATLVATQPVLADAELTNAAELVGKVALVRRGGDGIAFSGRAWRAQQAGAVAVIIVHNELETPVSFRSFVDSDPVEDQQRAAAVTIPSLCVGKADGERLLLHGGGPAVHLAYDVPAERAAGAAASVAQSKRVRLGAHFSAGSGSLIVCSSLLLLSIVRKD